MDPRFYQKIMQKYCFFSQKELRYLKSKISTKFHRFLFLFNFLAFLAFFFYFTYPNLSKNYGILCSVLIEGFEILWTISGNF